MKPIELSPSQLQQQIASGEIVEVGDRVKVVTENGKHEEFKVTSVTETSLTGADIDVPITEIVALESRRFSGGKTALLAGGTLLVYQLLAAVAIAATVGL